MPISNINKIRRELIQKIDKQIKQKQNPAKDKKETIKKSINTFKNKHYQENKTNRKEKWNIYINEPQQAELLKKYPYITSIYYDASTNYKNMNEYTKNITQQLTKINKILPNKELIWILPQILLDKDLPHVSEIITKLQYEGINIKIQTDNIGIAANLDVEKYGNNLNIYNNYTIKKLAQNPGFKKLVISNEISCEDIKLLKNNDCELEYIIFGHIQLMITKDNFENIIEDELPNTYYLIDKRNNKYLMKKDCYQNTHIYDYRILNLEKQIKKLRKTNINNYTIDCRFFNKRDTEKIIEHFQKIKENQYEKLELTENNNFFIGNIEKGVYKK